MMARELEFTDEEVVAPAGIGRWIVPALLVSLGLHALLYFWIRGIDVRQMSSEYYDRFVPRTFQIERVEIDPKLLEPEVEVNPSTDLTPRPLEIPQEKVAFEALVASPQIDRAAVARIEADQLASTPELPPTNFAATEAAARTEGARPVVEDADSLREALLADQPRVAGPDQAEIFLPMEVGGGVPSPSATEVADLSPGFSNLDDLLASTGPLGPETAPILMPTDLLFDYDSYELRPVARESLSKLAALIARNPQADFLIEGHTDSFGSDAYNLDLSTRRAASVKEWLVATMNIPAGQIRTAGLGESRLIAPPNGTIEEQAINRRVEIVIRASGTP